MESLSGVKAWIIENGSEGHFRGTLKYEKFSKVDLKVCDKVVESDRPKVCRWQSYGDACFSTLDEL